MNVYSQLIAFVIKKRISEIDFFKQNPFVVQNNVFKQLIADAKHTDFGVMHDFNHIKSMQDFKQKVPIHTYETLKPFIDNIRKGKQNVLWHENINWYAKSSGTTAGKSKYIPISNASLKKCHFKGGKDLMAIYLNQFPKTTILNGKSMLVGGSTAINKQTTNSYEGDLSAIIIKHLPLWFNLKNTPSKEIVLAENWEEKIQKIAEIVQYENVSNFSGVPSWNLIILQQILTITKKENITEVWPNIELYVHGGVNFAPYKKQYEQLIPSKNMHYLETYNASEGFFGIQDQDGIPELLLMLDYGIFYEFLPLEELNNPNAKTLSLEEVQLDTHYALIISTNAGLWRYMIGDTIRFTHLAPFRFQLSGRTKYFINLFGEELIEDNVNQALAKTSKLSNCIYTEYTIAPIFPDENGKGGHEWIIAFEQMPNNLEAFTKALDLALQAENSDYEAKRYKNLALQMPKIHMVTNASFYAFLKTKGKIGGQNKVPRMCADRILIEEFLMFLTHFKENE